MKLAAAILSIAVLLASVSSSCSRRPEVTSDGPHVSHPPSLSPRRIVSVAPSITEILVALGSGEQLVGVTDWCPLPGDASRVARIGGFSTPSAERILGLEPDLVLFVPSVLRDAKELESGLARARVATVALEIDGIDSALRAMGEIARATGASAAGAALVRRVRREIAAAATSFAGKARKRALVTVSRDPSDLYVAGSGTFVSEILELAGGENVGRARVGFYAISAEALITSGVDVIIDAGGPMDGARESERRSRAAWNRFDAMLSARGVRVRAAKSSACIRPGPRMAEGILELGALLHGEEGSR